MQAIKLRSDVSTAISGRCFSYPSPALGRIARRLEDEACTEHFSIDPSQFTSPMCASAARQDQKEFLERKAFNRAYQHYFRTGLRNVFNDAVTAPRSINAHEPRRITRLEVNSLLFAPLNGHGETSASDKRPHRKLPTYGSMHLVWQNDTPTRAPAFHAIVQVRAPTSSSSSPPDGSSGLPPYNPSADRC